MAHPAYSPEARAVPDDQGQTKNCTLHAVSKAVTEGIHGIVSLMDKIDQILGLNRSARLNGDILLWTHILHILHT